MKAPPSLTLLVLISTVWAQRTKRALTRALIGGAQPVKGWWTPVAQHTYKRKMWGSVAPSPKFVALSPTNRNLSRSGCAESDGKRHRLGVATGRRLCHLCIKPPSSSPTPVPLRPSPPPLLPLPRRTQTSTAGPWKSASRGKYVKVFRLNQGSNPHDLLLDDPWDLTTIIVHHVWMYKSIP